MIQYILDPVQFGTNFVTFAEGTQDNSETLEERCFVNSASGVQELSLSHLWISC